jgi:shikimate dehydrogenase
MDWTYELLDVSPGDLPTALTRLRQPDVAGANVTIPHKQAVMQHMDAVDPEAVKARAVNTIVTNGGRLIGSNTDIAAINAAVAGVGVEPKGANVVILGAGGSARAAAVALEGAHVTFVSRHPDDGDLPGRVIAWDDPALHTLVRSADVLLNATPLGRRDEMPIRPAALPKAGAVIDLVYVTGGTPLVRKARSLGLRTADGWEVLLAQGTRSFETWTGRPAPVSAMSETLQP